MSENNNGNAQSGLVSGTQSNGANTGELFDDGIPPEYRSIISSFLMSVSREQRLISSADSIAEKVTEEHITKMLDMGAKEDERSHLAFKWNRVIQVIVLLVSLGFAAFLLVFFKDSPHFSTIVTSIFSFLGGLGIGRFTMTQKE